MGPCSRFYSFVYIITSHFWSSNFYVEEVGPQNCGVLQSNHVPIPSKSFFGWFHVGAQMLSDRDALRTLPPNHLEWLIHPLFMKFHIVCWSSFRYSFLFSRVFFFACLKVPCPILASDFRFCVLRIFSYVLFPARLGCRNCSIPLYPIIPAPNNPKSA